ncbi:class I adenylate-forming enzyme family protein [Chloroflexota bacterium]
MTITQKHLIKNAARYFAQKTAIVCGDRKLTFSEVDSRANRLANALANLGLKPGARVATVMQNCLEYVETNFGLIKGGFPQITLNPRLTTEDLLFQLNDSEAEALIFQDHYAELINPIKDKLITVRHFVCLGSKEAGTLDYDTFIDGASSAEPEFVLNLDDLGELRYTSGTTGSPKGIMLPYRSWLAVTRNLLLDQIPDITSADNFLALQPLYHGAGWRILAVWVRGATHFITADFDAENAVNIIEKNKITVVKTVPTVLGRILDFPDISKRNLKSLKTLIYGASPMPVERLKQALDMFGPILVQGYGQTEAPVTLCVLNKADHLTYNDPVRERRLGSVGRPYTMVQIRIINEKGQDVKPGELGEVIVCGDHMMTGYLNRPDATADRIRNGWLYTADLATVDEAGYIFLSGGRKSDMIITGGLNVFPNEVEQILYEHPAVAEAAVIGVPDTDWGESITACIKLKDGKTATDTEIISFCKERLASYKKPRSVVFLNDLPKNAAGKILHRELREKYSKKS